MATILARAINLVAASVCGRSSPTAARTRTFVSTAIFTSCPSFLARPAASRSVIHLFDGCHLLRLAGKHAKEVPDASCRTCRPDDAETVGEQIQRNLFPRLDTEMLQHLLPKCNLPPRSHSQCGHSMSL